MTRRSLAAALVVSLALHVCLVLWLRGRPRPSGPAPASAPLEVELVFEEPPAPAPRPAEAPRRPQERAPAAAPGPGARAEAARPARPAPAPAAPSPAVPPEAAPREEVARATPSPEAAPAPEVDAPLARAPRVTLVPRSDFSVPPGLADGAAPTAPGGRTLRAGDAPEDRAARMAREGLEAGARLEEWASDIAGELRVRDGRMHPYYGELRRALEAQVRTPPKGLPLPSVPQELAARYLRQAQAYGAGGAPVADGAIGVERQMQTLAQGTQAFEREVLRDPSRAASVGRPRAGKDGQAPGAVLRAVVEVRQSSDGRFSGQVLLASSGNPLFDAFVLERAPLALEELAPPPPGLGDGGLRSTWAFEGRVTYRRKLRDFKLPQDAAYLAALLGTGQLGASFDLANMKDAEVPDVRNPRWEIKPVPLKVD